ncbi:MAG: gas vesicle protein GvpJ [Jatrophihabitans sp.]|uniref:gas vesicle protein GvpJ n=1 Tax=Jatrophihabitans sp. TaxID=1932789 RepID=UPI003F7EB9E1
MTSVMTSDGERVGLDGLVGALDALLAIGVSIAGDVIISVAGVDLIRLDLRALLAGVAAVEDPS